MDQILSLRLGETKMKKLITSTLLIVTALSLAACSNNKNASSKADPKDKTTQVSKKKSTPKKKTVSKKKPSQKKTSDQNANSTNTNNQNNSQQTDSTQQNQNSANQSQQASDNNTNNQQAQQQQSQSNGSNQQQAGGISYDENTLTGFVNKYGESPVLYKTQHGMSTLQALQSTPESMKTFGEQQLQTGMEKGYIDENGNYTGSDYSGQ